MKQSLASAPARTWNQKNLPSTSEGFEESNEVAEVMKQLPSAAAGFLRQHRALVILSLASLGAVALIWRLVRQ